MTIHRPHRPLRIALLGTRGIPARYGGFETFVEELGARLAVKGYEVTIYCRRGEQGKEVSNYRGIRLVHLPALRHKYFETVFHTFLSTLHVLFTRAEIVYYCNAINSFFTLLPRLVGKKVLINVDGLEWKRKKWSRLGQWAYRLSEAVATIFPHAIISDSRRIQLYYRVKFNKPTRYISYGADANRPFSPNGTLEKYGLKEHGYFLLVGRLEPENNAHLILQAYKKLETGMPLVVVGHAPYGQPYINALRSTRDRRVRFLGAVYGEDCHALYRGAFVYLHGHEVGGTNPALLEAMAYGNCVLVNGVRFNRDVVGDAGLWFRRGDVADLRRKMKYLLRSPEVVERFRRLAPERIRKHYHWDDVVARYERLFSDLMGRG